MAMLAYLGDGMGKDGLKLLTGAKILHELYKRFTHKDEILEALRVRTLYLYTSDAKDSR